MIAILIILVLLCLWKIRFAHFHENYCDKAPTTAIKGIFAFIILFSHLNSYIRIPENLPNLLYCQFFMYLGQSMVALFFFYSGYGICESLRSRSDYAENFFSCRFLKTLLFFELAVLPLFIAALFFRVDRFTGEPYPLKNYFLCWTGWESIGNSNWFMFVILALYLLTLICMKIRGGWLGAKMIVPTAILWFFLYKTHPMQPWWYDTLATFPLGMLFSEVKPTVNTWMRRPVVWWPTFIGVVLAYLTLHHLIGVDRWGVVNCIFCILVILLTMKVQVGNPALNWLGVNAFAIYMLQHLPMNILSSAGANQNLLIFIPCSVIATILLAEGFTRITALLDRKLFYRG